MDSEQLRQLLILDKKERLLSEIIVWLKAKNLWEQCKEDIGFHSQQDVNEKMPTSKEPTDIKDYGLCKEKNCDDKAVIDYNGYGHFVCQYHYDKLTEYFEENYR